MRADHYAVYVWMVVRWTCYHLVQGQGQQVADDILGEDGSGDLDPVAEVNIEVKVKATFRDLICFQCSGQSCDNHHYKEPLRHLVVSCQACYKEWDHYKKESTRKCFYPSDLTELDHSNISIETGMCGVIERGDRLSYYCFCYLDYCNHGNTLYPVWTGAYLILPLLLTYFLHTACFTYTPPGGSSIRGPYRRVGPREGCDS